MDLNNYKFVNDVFGQNSGDYALRSVANDLRKNLPPGSLYGRIGGDKLHIIRPSETRCSCGFLRV